MTGVGVVAPTPRFPPTSGGLQALALRTGAAIPAGGAGLGRNTAGHNAEVVLADLDELRRMSRKTRALGLGEAQMIVLIPEGASQIDLPRLLHRLSFSRPI